GDTCATFDQRTTMTTETQSDEPTGGEVHYRLDGHVVVITLDAPERRNALSVAMARELAKACLEAEADPTVGAVVVTGGEHFCAGAVRSVLTDTGRDPVE